MVLMILASPFVYYYATNELKEELIAAGRTFGTVAFILYSITLIPGIFGRFRIFNTIKAIITLFRRHIGVEAFLLAILHEAYIFTLPFVIGSGFKNFLFAITSHELLGFIALTILFPMWLTSNDFSERKLGRGWKLLHRITYIALVIIFLHIATASGSGWAYVALVMVVLELSSWIYFVLTLKKTIVPVQPPTAQTPTTPAVVEPPAPTENPTQNISASDTPTK